jgi:serine/threonine-protein kinase RsbW
VLPEAVRLVVRAPARPEALAALHGLLSRAWSRYPGVTGTDRMGIELAVAEIAANIVAHNAARPARIEMTVVEMTVVEMTVAVSVHADRVEVDLSDTGNGHPVDVAAARLPVDAMAERGRGLAMAMAAVDAVTYAREGELNRWRIVRHRSL